MSAVGSRPLFSPYNSIPPLLEIPRYASECIHYTYDYSRWVTFFSAYLYECEKICGRI